MLSCFPLPVIRWKVARPKTERPMTSPAPHQTSESREAVEVWAERLVWGLLSFAALRLYLRLPASVFERLFRHFEIGGSPQSARETRRGWARGFGRLVEAWPGPRGREDDRFKTWAGAVLEFCQSLAGENVRHPGTKLLSYHDVFLQLEGFQIVTDFFASDGTGRKLAGAVAEAFPESRVARIAHGRQELAHGNIDGAITAAKRALAVETGCPRAQKLLLEAYRLKQKRDPAFRQNDMETGSLAGRFCSRPFDSLTTVDSGGKSLSYLCQCGGWLPYSAGSVLDADNVDTVWNSPAARELRRSILDGDYSYCSRNLCTAILRGELPLQSEVTDPQMRRYIDGKITALEEGPRNVQLSHDASCNLACPTCRKEIITAQSAQNDRYATARDRVILPLLSKVSGHVLITGWGDPFASRHYRSILERLNRKDFPGLYLSILTNGQLLDEKQWESIRPAHEMITDLSVSVDAAREETYEDVRRPGRWSRLIPNLEHLGRVRKSGQLPFLGLNFVVQKKNFREMPEFVELGIKVGADSVRFMKYWNFGAQSREEFMEADVASPSHPLNAEFREVLRHPLMSHPSVNSYNLKSLFSDPSAGDGGGIVS